MLLESKAGKGFGEVRKREGLEFVNRWSGKASLRRWHLNKDLKEVYLEMSLQLAHSTPSPSLFQGPGLVPNLSGIESSLKVLLRLVQEFCFILPFLI